MPKLSPGAISMMMNNQQRDDGTGVSSLMMPLAGLLPESAAGVAEKAPRVEVLVPAKLKDPQFAGKPFQLGLILAFNAGKNRWVPEMLEISATLGAAGITPTLFEGAADIYRFVARSALGQETPENRDMARGGKDVVRLLAQERSDREG